MFCNTSPITTSTAHQGRCAATRRSRARMHSAAQWYKFVTASIKKRLSAFGGAAGIAKGDAAIPLACSVL